MPKLRRGGQVDRLDGIAQQQQTEAASDLRVEAVLSEQVGQLVDGRTEAVDLFAVVGGGEEEEVSLVVEVTEAVVDRIAAGEVAGGQIVVGIDGSAGRTLGAQIGGQIAALPGVEAVVGEDGGAAVGASLVDVDVVGPGKLRRGELTPDGEVILLQPPVQGLGVPSLADGQILQGLRGFGGVPGLVYGPAPRPVGAVVAEGLAELVQGADLDGQLCALAVFRGAQGVVAALVRGPEVVEVGGIGRGPAAVEDLEGCEMEIRLSSGGLHGQAESAVGQQQARSPGQAEVGHIAPIWKEVEMESGRLGFFIPAVSTATRGGCISRCWTGISGSTG